MVYPLHLLLLYVHRTLHRTSELTVRTSQAQGLVLDGTPCGENLICVNQTCTSVFPYQDNTKCPTNTNELECSGHGDCTNNNKCFCESSWSGPDCSIEVEMTPTPPLPTAPADQRSIDLTEHMTKKETPYESYHGSNTVFLVGTLMSVVGGVFVVFATMALCYRKTTVRKYEKPYVKKPSQKNSFVMTGNHSQEESLNNADKIMTYSASVPAYGDHKMQQLTRMVGSASEDDQQHSGEDETVSFIDLQHNNMKLPEKKGILKKHDYGLLGSCDGGKDSSGWGADVQHPDDLLLAQVQNDATMAQIMGSASMTEVERTLKSLNGYHEDILKALRNAANHRGSSTPSGSTSALSEEALRRSLQECAAAVYPRGVVGDMREIRSSSRENIMEPQVVVEAVDDDDEEPPSHPIRIRNLEDLIRQLEHHSQTSRHMSPSGSEDIRMSETEADRHYRQESSSACSESSHQSHRDSRFVYGRYRQPSSRMPYPHPHSHLQAEEESIYESADHDRVGPCGDTPDSESDEFIQAQQQLARWASEEAVAATAAPTPAAAVHQHQVLLPCVPGLPSGGHAALGPAGPGGLCSGGVPGGGGLGSAATLMMAAAPRDYFPSPSSSTSEEPTSIVRAPAPAPMMPVAVAAAQGAVGAHPEHATIHRPKRYPEYKH